VKVVLDTNVLLAGFATRGLFEAVLKLCLDSHEIFISQYILDEFERNLVKSFKFPADHAREIVSFLKQHATIVEPMPVPGDACRDKSDLPVLGTLSAAGGDCLVTGDNDLISLKVFEGMPILSPRMFYDQLRLNR